MIEQVKEWECEACEQRFYAPLKARPTFCPFGKSDRCPDLTGHGQRTLSEAKPRNIKVGAT